MRFVGGGGEGAKRSLAKRNYLLMTDHDGSGQLKHHHASRGIQFLSLAQKPKLDPKKKHYLEAETLSGGKKWWKWKF